MNTVTMPVQSVEKKTRYPSFPLKLNEYSQRINGRTMTFVYRNNGVKQSRVIACPLADEDSVNIGIEKIRSALINAKLSLSTIVDVKVNHSIGLEACKTIVRRAEAARK